MDFRNLRILLGITGGIAAYKSAYLVRQLKQLGACVRVVMTREATQFIGPLTLQALSGEPVYLDGAEASALHAMDHIELARWPDYIVIAPATANCIAKFAHGLADDLLSTIALVMRVPCLLCPGMNQDMWHHPATQANIAQLKSRGTLIVGPDKGSQACGDDGFGRMAEVDEIIQMLRLCDTQPTFAFSERMLDLKDRTVVITAGPTREALDPVRYLSNLSSGKMGYALARAAVFAGANVILIAGPTALSVPIGVTHIGVQSAQQMYDAVMKTLDTVQHPIFISTAAVSDFCVRSPAVQKIKKLPTDPKSRVLELVQTPDILAEVAKSSKTDYIVGFAAETHQVLEHAQEKLARKSLDLMIANQVGDGLGFEAEENSVLMITKTNVVAVASQHKQRLAAVIINHIVLQLCHQENPGSDEENIKKNARFSAQRKGSPLRRSKKPASLGEVT